MKRRRIQLATKTRPKPKEEHDFAQLRRIPTLSTLRTSSEASLGQTKGERLSL